MDSVSTSLWPKNNKRTRRRRHKKRKEERTTRKSKRWNNRNRRRTWNRRRRRREHRALRPSPSSTQDRLRRRERRSTYIYPGVPQGLQPITQQQYWRRRRRRKRKRLHTGLSHSFPYKYLYDYHFLNPLTPTYTHKHTLHPFITAPKTVTHPQTHTNTQNQDTNRFLSQPFTPTLSRHIRALPHHRPVIHPQAGEFMHPQAGVDISPPRFLQGRRGRGEKVEREERDRNQLLRECSKTMNWKKLSERR